MIIVMFIIFLRLHVNSTLNLLSTEQAIPNIGASVTGLEK